MDKWLLIFGMALVTFGVRYPVLAMVGRLNLPRPVLNALRFVPVAVLTAIVVPEMLMPQEKFDLSFNNAYLLAGLVAIGVSYYTKNLLATIVIGMGVFLLLRVIGG